MGAELLIDTLTRIETGNATYTKQDEKEVTFAPKLKKENGLIPWSQETQKYTISSAASPHRPGLIPITVKKH